MTSIDGISAYDLISRQAMLDGMKHIARGSASPFVSMFYGHLSSYLWEDAVGKVHTISHGEGGEQGDPMMPLLFSLGQHPALQRVQSQLREGEYLLAFLDDIYTVTTPERACEVHGFVKEALWSQAGIRVHQGKTQVWNQAGVEPPGCHRLQAEAVLSDPRAVVWRGPLSNSATNLSAISGWRFRMTGIVSIQLAQYAGSLTLTADLRPTPPLTMGNDAASTTSSG